MNEMIFYFTAEGDTLKLPEIKNTAYTGNINSYSCEFEFSNEWDGLNIFMAALAGNDCYVTQVCENRCLLPYEVLTQTGDIQIGLYGTNGDENNFKRISTNWQTITVNEGAYNEDTTAPTPPTPDIWESLLNKNIPQIGDNGNWYIWDIENNEYADSGKSSIGVQGDKGDKGDPGYTPQKGVDYFTAEDIESLGLGSKEDKANKVTSLSSSSTDTQYPSAKAVYDELALKADNLALTDYYNKSAVDAMASAKENTENKVTSLSSASTDNQYPSAKCVYDIYEALTKKNYPKTWADVQQIVRDGKAAEYFSIGDQFAVERLSNITASKGTSTGISAVTVSSSSFISGMGKVQTGAYIFTYKGTPLSWQDAEGNSISLGDYGITVTGTPAPGDYVTISVTTTSLVFDVIGIDHDTPVNSGYTHSMTLQLHNAWSTALMYDAPEAAFYIDEETYPNGLVAGTYNFTWNYSTGSMVVGTYQFTITEPVPVGGQIVIGTNSNSVAITSCKISTYGTAGSLTAIEDNIAITSGSSGTSLGTIKSDSITSGRINCAQRIMWGSNSWKLSGIRQWLNADGAANTWWEAKNVFDRPTNADKAGFLNNMDIAFLNVVGEVTKTTQKSVADGYGLETTAEKFFLLSRPEVYADTERNADGADGTVYAYYGDGHSDLSAPGTEADTNRIKYRNGSAQHWFLRTSGDGAAYRVRGILASGGLDIFNTHNSLGVVPACVIV